MSDHIPDATKMIGETPRTDAAWKPDGGDGYPTVDVDVARQLKLELNAANERIKNLESALSTVENIDKVNAYQDLESANERIKRLEEAGDAILNAENDDEEYKAIIQWNKAKEAKL